MEETRTKPLTKKQHDEQFRLELTRIMAANGNTTAQAMLEITQEAEDE